MNRQILTAIVFIALGVVNAADAIIEKRRVAAVLNGALAVAWFVALLMTL